MHVAGVHMLCRKRTHSNVHVLTVSTHLNRGTSSANCCARVESGVPNMRVSHAPLVMSAPSIDCGEQSKIRQAGIL